MIETGIPKLDGYLHGGVPEGRSLVYYTYPGVAGDVFGMQTICHATSNGRLGVYVASSTDPQMIRDQFSEFGWATEDYNGRFIVVDAFSGLIGADSQERYVVSDPEDINSLTQCIKKVMEEMSEPGIIVFESLSTIMDLCGESALRSCAGLQFHGMAIFRRDAAAREGECLQFSHLCWWDYWKSCFRAVFWGAEVGLDGHDTEKHVVQGFEAWWHTRVHPEDTGHRTV